MDDRVLSVTYVLSVIVMGGCAAITLADLIAGRAGAGFLPDTAKRILALAGFAAIALCAYSRCRGRRRF